MQHGEDAFQETVQVLNEVGICPAGLPDGSTYHSIPVIFSTKGVSFGLLGYSLRPEEYSPDRVLYCSGNEQAIIKDIELLRPKVNKIIILIHWGDEFIPRPAPAQVTLARKMVDHGADIILGHHPHVVQGIEQYKGAVIAYSLGNFIFDMWQPPTQQGIILKISCLNDGSHRVDILPTRINNNYQPEIMSGKSLEKFFHQLNGYNSQFSSYNSDHEDYVRELRMCFQQYRNSVKSHYLNNLFKYNILYLLQFVPILLLRRFFKQHI